MVPTPNDTSRGRHASIARWARKGPLRAENAGGPQELAEVVDGAYRRAGAPREGVLDDLGPEVVEQGPDEGASPEVLVAEGFRVVGVEERSKRPHGHSEHVDPQGRPIVLPRADVHVPEVQQARDRPPAPLPRQQQVVFGEVAVDQHAPFVLRFRCGRVHERSELVEHAFGQQRLASKLRDELDLALVGELWAGLMVPYVLEGREVRVVQGPNYSAELRGDVNEVVRAEGVSQLSNRGRRPRTR